MRRLLTLLPAVVLTVVVPEAQGPPTVAATAITGRVFDARDDAPLRRARVTITIAGRAADPTFTGDDGRFIVGDVPRPPFTLTVAKGGYTPGVLTVSAAQLTAPLQFALTRSVAVMGRVVDGAGIPLTLPAYVTARSLSSDRAGGTAVPMRFYTETDRLGGYRLGALAAGRYEITAIRVPPLQRVAAGQLEEALFGSPETFDVARTVTVSLEPGDERHNVDFTVPGSARSCSRASDATPGRQTGTARIAGRVFGPAGEPLACAQVSVSPDVGGYVHTDTAGRYSLEGLPGGTYVVQAFMPGYFSLRHGQRRPSDLETPIVLREGEWRDGVDITLPREAVVTGAVVDEHGEPVEGLSVSAFELRRRNGRVVAASRTLARPTDDRGQFRIIGVPPGSYLIGAVTAGDVATGGTARGYAPSYHPGSTDIRLARPVVIDAGAELSGIDILLTPVRTATVSGVVLDPAGRPFAGTVSLTASARSGVVSLGSRSAQTDAAGRFVLRSVPPGDYVLKAPIQAGGSPLFGMQYVTVIEADPPPVTLRLSEGTALEGQLVLDVAPGTNPAGLEVTYAPVDFDREPTVVRSSFVRNLDGTFRMTGAFGPGRLTLPRMPGCDTCYLKSARVNGTDATDTPIDFGLNGGSYRDAEVVISDAGATIEGRVVDEAEARAAFSMVVLPAADALRYPASRYVKFALRLRDGRFEAAGLPPGEYIVAATNSDDRGLVALEPDDPDFAALLATRGTRVTVLERERAVVNLRLLRR